jgi:DNA-binding GntR family transcriptional regulator
VVGKVLIRIETLHDIWDQHDDILKAIALGDGHPAEALARAHLTQAAGFMVSRLLGKTPTAAS